MELILSLLLSLAITIIIYPLPLWLFRKLVHKEPFSPKAAKIIVVVYGVVIFFVSLVLKLAMMSSDPTFKPKTSVWWLFVWGYVNFRILTNGYVAPYDNVKEKLDEEAKNTNPLVESKEAISDTALQSTSTEEEKLVSSAFEHFYNIVFSLFREGISDSVYFEYVTSVIALDAILVSELGKDKALAFELSKRKLAEFKVINRAEDEYYNLLLNQKISLFKSILNNAPVIGECVPNPWRYSEPLQKCIVAFGDMIFNPKRLKDYYKAAPVKLGLAVKQNKFVPKMQQLEKAVLDLKNELSAITKIESSEYVP